MMLSCVPTKEHAASPARPVCEGEPAEVRVGPAAASPIAVTNTNNAVIAANSDANANAKEGWATNDGAWGVEQLPRAQILARIAAAPTRVIVALTGTFDECRNGLSTHAYFEVPAAWGAKPFQAAVVTGEVLPWRRFDLPTGKLFVAGVRVGTLHQPEVASCHGPMPPRDAAVLALLPVNSMAEGLRVLERMR